MPREGRHPAAAEGSRRRGAPKGNLNALKTGRRSRQIAALTEAILANPDLLRLLLKLRRLDIQRNQALRDGLREVAQRRTRRSITQTRP